MTAPAPDRPVRARTTRTPRAGKTALVLPTPDRAAREAAARTRPGFGARPLEGVPVVYKDNIDIAGYPTRCGSPARAHAAPAQRDAEVVRRLSAAGALTVAKTHMPEHAFNGLGTNPHHPCLDNPSAPGHLPGGSSSGSAVAVATGLATVGIGTDTSGSVRVPAALCGLVGYRPSLARYPRRGVATLAPSLDTVGVITRDVDRLLAVDAVLQPARPALAPARPHHLHLCVPTGWLADRLTAPVRALFETSLAALAAAGATVRRARLHTLDAAMRLQNGYGTLVAHEAASVLAPYLQPGPARQLDPRIRERLEQAEANSSDGWPALLKARPGLQAVLQEELAGALLVLPTTPRTAPRRSDVEDPDAWHRLNTELLAYTTLTSYLDMPGVTLPLPVPHGPPAGLLLSAPTGHDERLLAAAAALEEHATGTHR